MLKMKIYCRAIIAGSKMIVNLIPTPESRSIIKTMGSESKKWIRFDVIETSGKMPDGNPGRRMRSLLSTMDDVAIVSEEDSHIQDSRPMKRNKV